MDVGQHHVQAGLHDAGGAAGQHGALIVQAAHQHAHALVQFTENVFLRHFAVFEHQLAGVGAAHAQLVQLLGAGETGEVALDDKGGDAARAGVRFGLGVDHIGVGIGAVGDPHFVAVEHVAVAFFVGAQAHAYHVGAGAGLAHGERADVLAADQFGQVLLALGVVAVQVDLVHAQVGVGAVGEADGRGGPGDFLHHQGVGQIAQAGAAVFLAHGDTQHAQIAELLPQLVGEQVVLVHARGDRCDLLAGEGAGAVLQRGEGVVELKIQAAVKHRFPPIPSAPAWRVPRPRPGPVA